MIIIELRCFSRDDLHAMVHGNELGKLLLLQITLISILQSFVFLLIQNMAGFSANKSSTFLFSYIILILNTMEDG